MSVTTVLRCEPGCPYAARMRRFLAWLAIALVLLGILVPVAALAFSVRVQGDSMTPTLRDGDRLLLAFWDRTDIERFDLVDAGFGQSGVRVVKRVIAMPGDEVAVAPVTGDEPRVFLRPAGEEQVYRVVNETWTGRVGQSTNACCSETGQVSSTRQWVTVPDESYWVLGDNWGGSEDSRDFGFVRAEDISGRLNVRIRPLDDLGTVATPVRLEPVD